MNGNKTTSVWYKEPWPIFFFGLLLVSVIFSLIFVARSLDGADDVVAGEYYKEGLGINERLERERYATELGLEVQLSFDTSVEGLTLISAEFVGGGTASNALSLRIVHPVEQNDDIQVVLTRDGQLFKGEFNQQLVHRRYIQLQDFENTWLLKGQLDFSYSAGVLLGGND